MIEFLHLQGAPRRVYYGGPPPPGTFLPRGGYPPPMAGGYDGGGGRGMRGRGRGRFDGNGGRGRYGPEGRGERRPPPGTPGVSSGVQVRLQWQHWRWGADETGRVPKVQSAMQTSSMG